MSSSLSVLRCLITFEHLRTCSPVGHSLCHCVMASLLKERILFPRDSGFPSQDCLLYNSSSLTHFRRFVNKEPLLIFTWWSWTKKKNVKRLATPFSVLHSRLNYKYLVQGILTVCWNSWNIHSLCHLVPFKVWKLCIYTSFNQKQG